MSSRYVGTLDLLTCTSEDWNGAVLKRGKDPATATWRSWPSRSSIYLETCCAPPCLRRRTSKYAGLCRALDIELTPARQAALNTMDADGLQALFDRITTRRCWDAL